jgi:chromate reductase, NAD(P)H dehydrogenase (quinone)
MIVIISATNRPNSNTSIIATHLYQQLLTQNKSDVEYVTLENLNGLIITADSFSEEKMDDVLKELQTKTLIPARQWIIVCPEYNGSIPGILKYWIDLLSIHRRNDTFKGKKISLVGVASGRAGNLRGLDQLSNLLQYLGSHIMPNKLPISMVHTQVDTTTNELAPTTSTALQSFVDEVIAYGA